MTPPHFLAGASAGDFVAQIPFFPPVQHPADFSDAVCRSLLAAAAGVPLPDVTIHTIRPWSMHAQVADRYSPPQTCIISHKLDAVESLLLTLHSCGGRAPSVMLRSATRCQQRISQFLA